MENLQPFENWLKAKEYKTASQYASYVRTIVSILMIPNFDKITSIVILKKLLNDVQKNRAFAARTPHDKSSHVSAFNTYIDFIDDKNQKK